MRRLIVLMVLVLAVAVFAQPSPVCVPDGQRGNGEECDPGTQTMPPDDSFCPGMCQPDCTCAKNVNYALFDLALGHNLLFSKVQDLLHVIKDLLFQLEVKTIEIQLTDFNCSSQPVSFWIPAQIDPYGKLNEIDQLIRLDIQSLEKGMAGPSGENAFSPLTSTDLADARQKLDWAETCISVGYYRQAFYCKCLAYRVHLLELTDTSESCNDPCGV